MAKSKREMALVQPWPTNLVQTRALFSSHTFSTRLTPPAVPLSTLPHGGARGERVVPHRVGNVREGGATSSHWQVEVNQYRAKIEGIFEMPSI